MVQTATVVSVNDDIAEIEVSRKAMCDGCHNTGCTGGCPMSGLVSSGGKMIAKAVNKIGAMPGDTVEVETADREVLGLAAAVFILPLLFGGALYAFAVKLGLTSVQSIVLAGIGFILPFPFLKIAEKRRTRECPKIIIKKVLKTAADDNDSLV